MVIDPQGASLQEWADAVSLYVTDAGLFGRIDSSRWLEWAAGLVRAPEFAQRVLPDPYQFSDWRAWAEYAAPILGGGL